MSKLQLTVSNGLRKRPGGPCRPDAPKSVRAPAYRSASGECPRGRAAGVAAGGVATSESLERRGPCRRAQRRRAPDLFAQARGPDGIARMAGQFLDRCAGSVQARSRKIPQSLKEGVNERA